MKAAGTASAAYRRGMNTRRQLLFGTAALLGTTTAWNAGLSTAFGPSDGALRGDPEDPLIRGLLARQLAVWEGRDPAAIAAMRATNPEWDFMGRSFLGLALCNLALRAPADAPRLLAALDAMLADTLEITARRGDRHWLLAYVDRAPFVHAAGTSVFVDGELAAVLCARRLVGGDARWDREIARYVARLRDQLDRSPLGHGESYPDECWAFCNAYAAVALALDQQTSGRDHRAALARWRAGLDRLVDRETGMLLSAYTLAGQPMQGPEGSSLFLVASHLALLDPALGRAQYALAQEHLLRDLLGFGWAREWPDSWRGAADIDSGPIVPGFDASAASSGLAFVGAGAYGDVRTLRALLASISFAGFPTWDGDRLSFAASNAVGDAVLLYALVQGPLWRLARRNA